MAKTGVVADRACRVHRFSLLLTRQVWGRHKVLGPATGSLRPVVVGGYCHKSQTLYPARCVNMADFEPTTPVPRHLCIL